LAFGEMKLDRVGGLYQTQLCKTPRAGAHAAHTGPQPHSPPQCN